MVEPDFGADVYVLGHSDRELERLRRQAQLIDPITRQFLIEAGIENGMRVLDVGSGAGDLAFLAANLVGPTGQVVGVDRSAPALARARTRAEERSLINVTFRESELSEIASDERFDAAIGRYVLCFRADPVSLVRSIANLVRPGGLILFHEPDREQMRSSPPAPTYDRACQWVSRHTDGPVSTRGLVSSCTPRSLQLGSPGQRCECTRSSAGRMRPTRSTWMPIRHWSLPSK
jgi:ubiquinone/menaquinone biosynthesis C-methylase UbiE